MPFNQQFSIDDNLQLRIPQREAWCHIRDHFARPQASLEVGIVLPVGCGKSGLIAITPFAVRANRVLVIAPGRKIRGQLGAAVRSNSPTNFYERMNVLAADQDFPEVTIIESGRVNMDDIRHCDRADGNDHHYCLSCAKIFLMNGVERLKELLLEVENIKGNGMISG